MGKLLYYTANILMGEATVLHCHNHIATAGIVAPCGQEGDWSALTYTGKGRFSMVQAVTYQSDKQSVYFQGKLIVLENLTPDPPPREPGIAFILEYLTAPGHLDPDGSGHAEYLYRIRTA